MLVGFSYTHQPFIMKTPTLSMFVCMKWTEHEWTIFVARMKTSNGRFWACMYSVATESFGTRTDSYFQFSNLPVIVHNNKKKAWRVYYWSCAFLYIIMWWSLLSYFYSCSDNTWWSSSSTSYLCSTYTAKEVQQCFCSNIMRLDI